MSDYNAPGAGWAQVVALLLARFVWLASLTLPHALAVRVSVGVGAAEETGQAWHEPTTPTTPTEAMALPQRP